MAHTGLSDASFPGFDRALVERSWQFLGHCKSARIYDSEGVRADCMEKYPDLSWENQVVPAIKRGVEQILDDCHDLDPPLAVPFMIHAPELNIKVPVDLRHAVDAPTEQVAAVMRVMAIDALPEVIRFGDPDYLSAQRGKSPEEAIKELTRLSQRKRRFFTCNEIDHHLFSHVFDNGSYRRTFETVMV